MENQEITSQELQALVSQAVNNVHNDYYKVAQLERSFCYEFYHQFRCLAQSNSRFKEYILTGEPSKHVKYKLGIDDNIKDKTLFLPDMVYHKGIQSGTSDGQLIAIEMKCSNLNARSLAYDILKLLTYIDSEGLNYKLGVFIAINMTENTLKDRLGQIFKNPMCLSQLIDCASSVLSQKKESDKLEEYFKKIVSNDSLESCSRLYFIATEGEGNAPRECSCFSLGDFLMNK